MSRLAEWFARPYVALCFLALGMAVIPLNDALIKLLGETMPLGQIVAIRSLMSLAFIALFSSGLRRMTGLSSSVFWQFVGRGMCLVVAMILFFASLGSLSLASAVAIFFTAPLLITLLSVPLLGEKIGIHRVLSVIAGMAGCLLIIRPGTADFQGETLLVLGSALSYALFQIWTRRLKSVGDLPAMVAVQHCCYAVAGGAMVLFNFALPFNDLENASLAFLLRGPISVDATDLVFIFVCAFAVLLLSVASSNAYRCVEASLIAPFEYTAIPMGVFWGIVIWDDWPVSSAWAGMALILVGGLYAVYREHTRNVAVITQVPMPASTAMVHQADVGADSAAGQRPGDQP
ncbi:MAG: DMT family transporter [Candidatus Puniceispirillaceae bacterium]